MQRKLDAAEASAAREMNAMRLKLDAAEASAAALTAASGVECTYRVAVPRFIMRCVMKDLNAMIEFFETTGYDSDIAAFKAVVPDAQDCKAWFEARGVKAWSEEASSSWF